MWPSPQPPPLLHGYDYIRYIFAVENSFRAFTCRVRKCFGLLDWRVRFRRHRVRVFCTATNAHCRVLINESGKNVESTTIVKSNVNSNACGISEVFSNRPLIVSVIQTALVSVNR